MEDLVSSLFSVSLLPKPVTSQDAQFLQPSVCGLRNPLLKYGITVR